VKGVGAGVLRMVIKWLMVIYIFNFDNFAEYIYMLDLCLFVRANADVDVLYAI
jgi:hypothetical protein